MAFTFGESNTFRNVGIGTTDNKIIIMNVSKSKENLSFHSTTNDTSVDIMSIKTILNKDDNDELNISGYDGQFINPIIKINNTNQEINITSNLNIVRNLNVAHNVVIDGMANNDEYVLDIKNQDRKNCVVAIRSHLDSNIYDVFSYPSLLFSQFEDITQTSIGLGPRSYNTGYGNTNNSTFYIEQKNKSGIRFAVDCDSVDGGKEMLFLDGNNLGVYIRQNTDILGNLNISHNLNIDNLTITHNSISTNENPYEIAFLDNSLIDIGYIKTTNAHISDVGIEGGLINNTIIGNITPNTGKFTTLNTTSNATIDGALSINDTITFSNANSKNFVINKGSTTKAHITTDGFAKFDKLKISIDDADIDSHTSDLWIYNNSSNDSLLKLETAGSDKKNVITFKKPNNSATITYDTDNILKIVNNESSYGAISIGNENNQSLFQNNNDGFTTFKRNGDEKLVINKNYVQVKGKFENYLNNIGRQTDFNVFPAGDPVDDVYITSGTGWQGFNTNEHTPICEFKSTFNGRVTMHSTSANCDLHVDGSINSTKLSILFDHNGVEKAYINNDGHMGCESLYITGSAQHSAQTPSANIKTLSLNADTSLHLRANTDKNHRLEHVNTADIPWNGATSTDTGYIGNRIVDGFRLIGNLGGVIGKRKNSGDINGEINGISSAYYGPDEDEIIMWLHNNIDFFKPVICKTNLTVDGTFTNNSDGRIKINKVQIINAINTINKLEPQFYFKTKVSKGSYESGLIAQDIYNNAPELRHLVSISDDAKNNSNNFNEDDSIIENILDSEGNPSYLTLNYIGIIPYLIGAVKEMSAKINSLETELNNLKSQ